MAFAPSEPVTFLKSSDVSQGRTSATASWASAGRSFSARHEPTAMASKRARGVALPLTLRLNPYGKTLSMKSIVSLNRAR